MARGMTGFRAHRDNQRVLIEMWTVDALDGDHAAAALLSQLLWWFQPAKGTRTPRVRYERDGHLWLIRSDDDWFDDCRLTTKQVRRIRKLLIERGLIVHRRFQVNGAPTGAWRPDFEALERYVTEYEAERPNGQSECVSSAQMGESIRPLGQVPIDTNLSHTPNNKSEHLSLVASDGADCFDEFWRAYPRNNAKPAARTAWAKAIRKTDPAALIAAAERYAKDPNRLDQFTPYAQKWLNQEMWNDGPCASRTGLSRPVPARDNVMERSDFTGRVRL
jgi:hypothetical protein